MVLNYCSPDDRGFDSIKLRKAIEVLHRYVEKAYPGAVLLVLRDGCIVLEEAVGYAQLVPKVRTLTKDTLFDLASLTKPLVGALLTMKLVEEGIVYLKQRVVDILPDFRYTPAGPNSIKEKVKLWMLLAHTSGLPPWIPLYRYARSREEVFYEALRAFPSYEPGERIVYSDIGFIVLTHIVEEMTRERIDRLFEEIIAKPLNLRKTLFNPLKHGFSPEEIAATEEKPERGGVIVGEVHDENAFAMEGISMHAGLFSIAREIAEILNTIIATYRGLDDRILSMQAIKTMLRPWICSRDECYGLGWVVYSHRVTISGGDFLNSGRAFGHTGFTGTSIWIDLDLGIAIVFLTNRVHPTRENNAIAHVRPLIHNTILAAVKK